MNFSVTQQAEIDGMVRTKRIIPRPPYYQSHVWTAMIREVKAQMAALPPSAPTRSSGDVLYDTNQNRFQGRLNNKWYAIHEAEDDSPMCQITEIGWHEVRLLGPGGVTCGHCANKHNS